MDVYKAAKLILDIQAPSIEECWSDGYEASSEISIDANPYKPSTVNYYHWSEGWWAGFYEKDNGLETMKIVDESLPLNYCSANDNTIHERVVEYKK